MTLGERGVVIHVTTGLCPGHQVTRHWLGVSDHTGPRHVGHLGGHLHVGDLGRGLLGHLVRHLRCQLTNRGQGPIG